MSLFAISFDWFGSEPIQAEEAGAKGERLALNLERVAFAHILPPGSESAYAFAALRRNFSAPRPPCRRYQRLPRAAQHWRDAGAGPSQTSSTTPPCAPRRCREIRRARFRNLPQAKLRVVELATRCDSSRLREATSKQDDPPKPERLTHARPVDSSYSSLGRSRATVPTPAWLVPRMRHPS